ncbi:MAG: TonB-dependent receptor [Thermoanaerobaculia bacterium]
MKQPSQSIRTLGALVGLLVVALFAQPMFAQGTTSSVRGVIKDGSGPIADAQITATDVANGFHRTVQTGADGAFSLQGLAPGTYEIKVSSPAVAEQSRKIQLLVGQNVVADFLVSPSEVVVEGITVTGEATDLLLDTRNSEISTNITQQQLENLPQNSRNFLSFAGLAPGVQFTQDNDAAGQSFRSGGSNPKQINVFVDGQSYKNDLIQGGAFMQDTSRGNPFPQGAVQEYKVFTQNYKAEYEKAAAAVITAVTKSGGNDYHGDAFYLFQNRSMVSLDTFAKERGDKKPDYERNQYGLTFGGPIQQDKLHFFLSFERNDRDVFSSVTRGSQYNSAPANVRARLDTFDIGTLSAPLTSNLYFGKLDWQPTESQTVALSYYGRDEDELRGFGGQRVRQGAENFKNTSSAFVLRHQWVGGGWFNEASVTKQKMDWNPTAVDSSLPHENYVGLLDIGSRDSSQDVVQDKVAIRDDLSYFLEWHGSHSLKGGITANAVDYDISKTNFANPYFEYRSSENWQHPFLARFGFGDPSLDFSNEQYGAYVQDDWALLPNVTVNLGLRYDYETNMLNNDWVTPPDVANGLRTSCRNYSQPIGGQTQWCIPDIIDVNNFITDGSDRSSYTGMIQPRVGVTWDVKGTGETVVFGGWGKYYDRVTLNDIFDEQFRHSFKTYEFCFQDDDGTQPDGCGTAAIPWNPAYLSAGGLADLIASGSTPGPELYLLANDTRPPYANQWTVGLRQKLGNWMGSLSYANSRGYNGLSWGFGTLPPGAAFNDRFGLEVQIPGYGFILRSSDVRRTWYDGIFLTLDKPFTASSGWGANIAYTYGKGFQNGTLDEGTAFGFDYVSVDDFYKFPANGDERNRLVMSGTVALPWSFMVSSIITLGSGTPYTFTDCSAGFANCVTHFNGGRPEKKDFIIPNAWAYRSVDLRLEWQAPAISDRVRIAVTGEAFNVFDFNNYSGFDSFIPPEGNPNVGNPTVAFNARRFQIGARVSF